MADSDAKHAVLERRKALQEKAEAAVPKAEALDGLPNLVTRRVFRVPLLGIPADLKALVMGGVAGAATFMVLLTLAETPLWLALIGALAVLMKVNSDFVRGDGIEIKAIKPQRQQSRLIADAIRMGPDAPDEHRLLVVHRGREVPYLQWLAEQEAEDRRMAERNAGKTGA